MHPAPPHIASFAAAWRLEIWGLSSVGCLQLQQRDQPASCGGLLLHDIHHLHQAGAKRHVQAVQIIPKVHSWCLLLGCHWKCQSSLGNEGTRRISLLSEILQLIFSVSPAFFFCNSRTRSCRTGCKVSELDLVCLGNNNRGWDGWCRHGPKCQTELGLKILEFLSNRIYISGNVHNYTLTCYPTRVKFIWIPCRTREQLHHHWVQSIYKEWNQLKKKFT